MGKAKNPHAVALGRKGGKKGGKARWAGVTAEERREKTVDLRPREEKFDIEVLLAHETSLARDLRRQKSHGRTGVGNEDFFQRERWLWIEEP